MRTIQINFDSAALNEMCDNADTQEVRKAIGYLSSWCPDSFPIVDIFRDTKTDLMAVYRKRPYEQGDLPGYVIGGIWDSGSQSYSFHS